ncbi:MAG: hypothetical protein ACLP01_19555 [Solirubrobacteraceae bacterium]
MRGIIRTSAILSVCGSLMLAAVALAASQEYSGPTSQKYETGGQAITITMVASGSKVESLEIRNRFPIGTGFVCHSAPFFTTDLGDIPAFHDFHGFKVKNDAFKATNFSVGPYEKLTINGKFKHNSVSGSFTVNYAPNASEQCSSGNVTYKAKALT